MAACQNFATWASSWVGIGQNHGHIINSIWIISADDLITDTVAAVAGEHIADTTHIFQNKCIELTHVHISDVDIQFGTVGAQQETKHGSQESNGLEASCKAQNNSNKLDRVVWQNKCIQIEKTCLLANIWHYKSIQNPTGNHKWWSLTYIEGGVFCFSKVVNVGDAQRCDRGFSDPPQSVPEEHIDPHARTGLSYTGLKKTNKKKQ